MSKDEKKEVQEETQEVQEKTFLEKRNAALTIDEKMSERVAEKRKLLGNAYCKKTQTRLEKLEENLSKIREEKGFTSPEATDAVKLKSAVEEKFYIFADNNAKIEETDLTNLILKHEIATGVKTDEDEERGKNIIATYEKLSNANKKLEVAAYKAAIAFKEILEAEELNSNLEDYKKSIAKVEKDPIWNTNAELMMDEKYPLGKMDFTAIAAHIHEFVSAKKTSSRGSNNTPSVKLFHQGGKSNSNYRKLVVELLLDAGIKEGKNKIAIDYETGKKVAKDGKEYGSLVFDGKNISGHGSSNDVAKFVKEMIPTIEEMELEYPDGTMVEPKNHYKHWSTPK